MTRKPGGKPYEASFQDDALLTPDEVSELTEAEDSAAPVSYMGSDFDVEGLVRRLGRDDIVIPSFGHNDATIEVAGFQRGFVWARNQMDRFIESLLLGYPIPGIMLVQQPNMKYLVLDGQQRLRTLAAFYEGVYGGKEFALRNVAEEFKGLTYKTLEPELRRQLDNTFIQATIVRTDGTRGSREAIYQVFERLNSGGTQLTPHEIRIALYAGPLIDYIDKLNKSTAWRQLYGSFSPRLRDQELVLRIIALFTKKTEFYRPLKKYLNDFAEEHRELKGLPTKKITKLFDRTAELLLAAAGRESVRYQSQQVNAALTEALFVALMSRLETTATEPAPEQIAEWITTLTKNRRVIPAITRSTSSEENVRVRHRAAMRIFTSEEA
ncbi:hypothetical protein GCM10010492_25110 [Saccharothrix mutabilis subsp. mutabilis]|uniref:GmrSD restriction endonucleases N-terminal domain-containing protein n=1 Tax=Saccharothrix mutabilis subsp. mutabilis TaxID=66855 RepID=A0ABN0TN25_9PSEU